MMEVDVSAREIELKIKKICRFCLLQQSGKLNNIFDNDKLGNKATAPLTTQVLAIASIEVFLNDGMPSWVCYECRLLFEYSYRFKQMCKRAETLLKQYPLTGTWPSALTKPRFPLALMPKHILADNTNPNITVTPPAVSETILSVSPVSPTKATSPKTTLSTSAETAALSTKSPSLGSIRTYANKSLPNNKNDNTSSSSITKSAMIKILNANPVASPEPPIPFRVKREDGAEKAFEIVNPDNDANIQNHIKNISLENTNVLKRDFKSTPISVDTSKKPRVLNKASFRILNKNAEIATVEPRLSEPQVTCDKDGNMAIVTEILAPDEPYETESDPVKSALPVVTNVYPCPHCERSFPLRQLRDIHLEKHKRLRSFPCPECDRSFFSKYDLQKHSLIHSGDRPYKCKVCDRGFTRTTLLYRHEKSHTDMPKYLCVYCEKAFLSKDQMEKHAELHLKNRPFQCKVCSKSFAFKQGLERHEVVHSRDQPYACQYCNESFSTPSKLARHLTAHAGKRPYPCKFCSKSYLLSHHLTRHLRSHTPDTESLFQCGECKLDFKTREALITHSVTHGTETLSCPLCKETFASAKTVEMHINAHVESETYACEFCDLIFMLPERLQEHIDFNHIDDMRVYHEDDMAQSQKIKNSVNTIDDLQQTLDDILTDDTTTNDVEDVKEETVPTNAWNESEIASNVVIQSTIRKNKPRKSQDVKEVIKESPRSLPQPPPLKIPKVESNTVAEVCINNVQKLPETRRKVSKKPTVAQVPMKTTNKMSENESDGKSPELRRKLPIKPVVERQLTIKVNNNIINESLRGKNTQVMQRTVAGQQESSLTNVNKPQDNRAHRAQRVYGTRSNEANKKDNLVVATTSDTTTPKGNIIKRSTNHESTNAVKKISLTRAEAETLAKGGSIRLKDGNVYLTKTKINT